jgi:hypothetical protein
MNKFTTMLIVAIIAITTAGGLTLRIFLQKRHFDRSVKEALKTSEGYDQKFIDMVNRLENELALRASFGYIGQKDPLTGKERLVVQNRPQFKRQRVAAVKENEPEPAVDSVKLTAIIFDDVKKSYSAIIMVGERSFAIESGDYVVGRLVTTISAERVVMEDDDAYYMYEITGRKGKREKFKAEVVPP